MLAALQAVTIPLLALLLGWGETLARRLRTLAVLGLACSFGASRRGSRSTCRRAAASRDRLVAIARTIDRAPRTAEVLASAPSPTIRQ